MVKMKYGNSCWDIADNSYKVLAGPSEDKTTNKVIELPEKPKVDGSQQVRKNENSKKSI
jgi:hypothetical protein